MFSKGIDTGPKIIQVEIAYYVFRRMAGAQQHHNKNCR